ncbi:unnamed protein product [marine sediment metagenome]|uniref:Uncharacterized protein n=2 Tax=marine sediment metagenome TaxID=412755 RepID=X1SIK1_9ZZZZ
MSNDEGQYLIFLKYQREYLSQVTGYSKGYLSRVATGAKPPSEVFIGVCCHTLKEPQEELFKLVEPQPAALLSAQPRHPNQDLIETIDELASRLTKAEAQIEALKAEFKQYG